MSSKIKRKKKPATKIKSAFRPTYVNAVIANNQKYIRVYGGMSLTEPDSSGFEGIGLGLPRRQGDALTNEVVDYFRRFKRTWSILLMAFCIVDGEETVRYRQERFADHTTLTLDKAATVVSDAFWEALPVAERISLQWVACPCTDVDLLADQETYVNYFASNGKPWNKGVITDLKLMKNIEGKNLL